MMLQIRMGHISSPPFWRYSITAHLLVPFGLRRKPGRAAAIETERTSVTDLFGSGGASSASPASQSSALQASPSAGGRILCFFLTFCLVRYFRFVGDGLGATVWSRSFPAPS